MVKFQQEETIRQNLKSSFECGVNKKPIISSYVVFNNSPIFFDSKNEPQAVYLKNKDSLIIYNRLVKNRLFIRVKDAEGKVIEYSSTKPQLQRLVDNISEFYAIEYLYNNWDEIINRCNKAKD